MCKKLNRSLRKKQYWTWGKTQSCDAEQMDAKKLLTDLNSEVQLGLNNNNVTDKFSPVHIIKPILDKNIKLVEVTDSKCDLLHF